MESSKKRVDMWIDCDPGHDDCFGLTLACYPPPPIAVNLLGVSTVHGNQTVDKTAGNALNWLHACGVEDVDVYRGQAAPLVRKAAICPEIHGESGLDGFAFPQPHKGVRTEKAVMAMADRIMGNEGKVTIAATGCLTNIALLLTLFPEVKPQVDRIVMMGGAMGLGNTGPVMEWNIQIDPEAAHIVFESGLDVWMVPLEVTHKALLTQEHLQTIKQMGGPFSSCCVSLLTFFSSTYSRVFAFDQPPLHDPCAMWCAISKGKGFTHKKIRVDIEMASSLTAGQTVCDFFNLTHKTPNVQVCTDMDLQEFWRVMLEAVRRAAERSPL